MRPIGFLAAIAPVVLLVTLPCLTAAAECIAWEIDYERSRLGFTAVQADAEFDGSFDEFEAEICFSPQALEASYFHVAVQLASVNTENLERDEILRGNDFFAASQYPVSRFSAEEFREGTNQFLASGELRLRGVTMPLTVPFQFTAPGATVAGRLTGGVTLSRLAFGIGQGEWQDTTWVGDTVKVDFDLYLMPAASDEAAGAGSQAG